jgi:hypothetical protein
MLQVVVVVQESSLATVRRPEIVFKHDAVANAFAVTASAANSRGTALPQLKIFLPEQFNLKVDAACSVAITDKLVGDVDVSCLDGDVIVNKLR